MDTGALLRSLGRAEKRLGIDGLYLALNTDASGSVMRFGGAETDGPVFVFGSLAELRAWMYAPCIVLYDGDGVALAAEAKAAEAS
jgi:hypothetical protein